MKIPIKYPRKKTVEAENIIELQKQLKILMVDEFDIKNTESKPFVDIKTSISAKQISSDDFELLRNKDSIIIPTVIKQCET